MSWHYELQLPVSEKNLLIIRITQKIFQTQTIKEQREFIGFRLTQVNSSVTFFVVIWLYSTLMNVNILRDDISDKIDSMRADPTLPQITVISPTNMTLHLLKKPHSVTINNFTILAFFDSLKNVKQYHSVIPSFCNHLILL